MKKIAFSALLATAILAMTGCMSNSIDVSSSRLRVRSFIDGCDVVKIQGDKVWFEHKTFSFPGAWKGFNEATFVNGEAWTPAWNGMVSDKFEIANKESALPAQRAFTADNLKVYANCGLGRFSVAEYPSADNEYTLAITLDDSTAEGASWYELGIDWED